jgi:geranylgeranyl pyrophosphate synthase
VLCLASSALLGVAPEQIRPFALAIELVHTFSLVHDDLPIMDNDDLRRGLPTTHKKFGEACALLAGDALLGRAFGLLAEARPPHPAGAAQLLKLLSDAVVSLCDGQMLDLQAFNPDPARDESPAQLEERHLLKTAALITAAVVGPSCFLPDREAVKARAPLTAYGKALGLLFQITDDILDARESAGEGRDSGRLEPLSYVSAFGLEKARKIAAATAEQALSALEPFGSKADFLGAFADFILNRKQ